jgi:hypothetical protein
MQSEIDILIENFPWFSQENSHINGSECCTTACSYMCLKYFKPDSLVTHEEFLNKCLELNKKSNFSLISKNWVVVTQTKALAFYGINSKFSFKASFDNLDEYLYNKIPVIIVFNHIGTRENPNGGHLAVVIGKTVSGNYILNDPLGSLNNCYKGPSINGKTVIYDREELIPRWCHKQNNGYARFFIK